MSESLAIRAGPTRPSPALLLLVLLSVALAFSGAKGLPDAIASVQRALVSEPARKPSGQTHRAAFDSP